MKKLLHVAAVFCLMTVSKGAFAQIYGVKAGLNLTSALMRDDAQTFSDEFSLNPGFHAGLTAELPIFGILSLESGIMMNTKGFIVKDKDYFEGSRVDFKNELSCYYLDIPLLIKISFVAGESIIYLNAGPYAGYGISGRNIYKTTYMGFTETETERIKWGSNPAIHDLRRFDYGLLSGAGIDISGFQLGIGYSLGLNNISPYTNNGNILKHRGLLFSLAYRWGDLKF